MQLDRRINHYCLLLPAIKGGIESVFQSKIDQRPKSSFNYLTNAHQVVHHLVHQVVYLLVHQVVYLLVHQVVY